MGWWGWSQGICLYIFSKSKYIQGPIEFGQYSEKLKFHRYPLFGGRGKKCYGGVRIVPGYMYVIFFPNQMIFCHPFTFNYISPLHAPPLIRPWGTSLHKRPEFFIAHIFVGTLRNPNLPKSAYPSLHQTLPLRYIKPFSFQKSKR